jgi:hypothetical protein
MRAISRRRRNWRGGGGASAARLILARPHNRREAIGSQLPRRRVGRAAERNCPINGGAVDVDVEREERGSGRDQQEHREGQASIDRARPPRGVTP